MKKNTTNRKALELEALQKVLLSSCIKLNRPIRKSQLIKMVTVLFECNTPKQIEFALLDLMEKGQLCEQNHFIVTPEFYENWDKIVTAADEGIVKYLLTLKEETKRDIFFHAFAEESLTPSIFFKYVQMKYPSLLSREDTALILMEQMSNTFPYGLSDAFYAEANDYPTNGWLTALFDNTDCRLIVKHMDFHKKHINIHVVLLSGKKRSFKLAHEQFEEFQKNMKHYFNRDMHLHIKATPLTMYTGNKQRKQKQ